MVRQMGSLYTFILLYNFSRLNVRTNMNFFNILHSHSRGIIHRRSIDEIKEDFDITNIQHFKYNRNRILCDDILYFIGSL